MAYGGRNKRPRGTSARSRRNGRAAIEVFRRSGGYWINSQGQFDLEMAKDKVGKHAEWISPCPHGADAVSTPSEGGLVCRYYG
jgi:hypothetical protein